MKWKKRLSKACPLGRFKNYPYKEERVELHSCDVVLLMTDGLPELFNINKEMFGSERIKEVFFRSINKSAEKIIFALVSAGEDWRGDEQQADDITLIVLKAN